MAISDRSPVDELTRFYEALAHARRRQTLRILDATESPMALDDLALKLTIREQEAPASTVNQDQTRRCSIALYHRHLPKLAAAGMVAFDTEQQTVALNEGPAAAHAARHLALVDDLDDV